MNGSSFLALQVHRRLPAGLPASTTAPPPPPFEERGVAGKVEPALLLVGIVAGEALVLQQRPDVVVVGEFLGVLGADGAGEGDGRREQ